MSDLLVEFLDARIAEDEDAARRATVGPWWYDPRKMNAVDHEESVFAGRRGLSATTVASTGPCDDIASMADAAHIARHNPERVLAECEAKRRIVILHSPYDGPIMSDYCQTCGTDLDDEPGKGETRWPCDTIRALALPYAEHPDYREEWRP